MEVRKIIKLGDATLCVTLPKYWTEQQNIAKGEHVQVVAEEDGSLVLRQVTSSSQEITTKTIDSKSNLFHSLRNAYIEGFDEIIVKGSVSREELFEITNKMIALQVMSTSESEAHLKIFVDDSYAQFSTLLSQLHTLIITQLRKDTSEESERILYLCKRILTKHKRTKKIIHLTHVHALSKIIPLLCETHPKESTLTLLETTLNAVLLKKNKEKAHLMVTTVYEKLQSIKNKTAQIHMNLILHHIEALL